MNLWSQLPLLGLTKEENIRLIHKKMGERQSREIKRQISAGEQFL